MKINFLGHKEVSKEKLVDEICAKLTKLGFKWKMVEEDLAVTMNDNHFRVIFWESCNKTNLRTYFIWYYSDEYFKRFKDWMLDLTTCMTNREHKHTTSMMIAEDEYCCRFECAVCNVDDFLMEFKIAYKHILDAAGFFFEKLKQVDERGENEDCSTESNNMEEDHKEYPWDQPIEKIIEKANNGDGESLLRIGVCYQLGVYGFEKDKGKAVEYYHKAIDENNYQAMFNLAAIYSNADGVAYDHDKAIELLSRIEKESNSLELVRKARLAKKQVDNLEQVKYLFK
ncbi:MAG: sel1 repeat family protein [Bacteroidales bacterium]|nr:sel1 repeat family protein [Bacteroidales bacterium]